MSEPTDAERWAAQDRFDQELLDGVNRLLDLVGGCLEDVRALRSQLVELGLTVSVNEAASVARDQVIHDTIEALDRRLTTVHAAALRALNSRFPGAGGHAA